MWPPNFCLDKSRPFSVYVKKAIKLLHRRVPPTVLSWRMLLFSKNRVIRLRRMVFFNSWPNQSRLLWLIITLYFLLKWYLFYGWLKTARVYKWHRSGVLAQHGVGKARQALILFKAAFLNGITPEAVYQFALYNVPEEEWLDYVYRHETEQFHAVISRSASSESIRFMTSKAHFAKVLRDNGLPYVETMLFLNKGEPLKEDEIIQKRSLFFKPEAGSRGEGCFILEYDAASGTHTWDGNAAGGFLAHLTIAMKETNYLVQPLLKNSDAMESLCGNIGLVVVRLVTGMVGGAPKALYAMLQVPVQEKPIWFRMASIDVDSGKVLATPTIGLSTAWDEERLAMVPLTGKAIPDWAEALNIAKSAHFLAADIPTVGWDVAFTEEGPVLLEGNIGWGIDIHELHLRKPALTDQLSEVDGIWSTIS